MPENVDFVVEQHALREHGILGRSGPFGNILYAYPYDLLPPEAKQVIEDIAAGGPFLFPKHDGNLYRNRSEDLPGRITEYREFTVPTPGITTRGKRRLVARSNGILFFTACHYDRVPGKLGSADHTSAITAVDERWRNGFYVLTGVPSALTPRIVASLKKIHDARLPVLYGA